MRFFFSFQYFIGLKNLYILEKKFLSLLIFKCLELFDILFRNYFIRDNQISQSELNTCNMYSQELLLIITVNEDEWIPSLLCSPELKDAEQTLGNEMPSGDVDLCIGQ